MITNTGTSTSPRQATWELHVDLTGTVTNNGEIDVSTGTVNVTGNITGTGSIDIFNNAKLEIGGSVSSGEIVNFGATAGR